MPLGSWGRGHSARTKIGHLRAATGAGRVEPLERRTLFSSGDLDPTFGGDGKVTVDVGGSASDEFIREMAVQSDGKIIIAARHGGFGAGDGEIAVTRFNTDGTVDTTFGDNGLTVIHQGDLGMLFPALAVGPDDKIAVATWVTNPPTDFLGADSDAMVAVLNADGSFDTGFDGDGIRIFDFGRVAGGPAAAKTTDFVFDVAFGPLGKVVTAGSISINGQGRVAVARLNPNGTLDTSFDGDGVATPAFGNYQANANSLDVDGQGRVVVGGQAGLLTGSPPRVTNYDFAVARFNTNGSLDTTFDGDGWTVTPFTANDDIANRVEFAPGGKIVAAGSTFATTTDMAVARYNADGSLDTTFSGDGKASYGITRQNASGQMGETNEQALGLAVQPDGAVVMSGRSVFPGFGNTLPQTVLVRLSPSGSPDTGFGPEGNARVVVPELDEASGLALQSDGYILAGGSISSPTSGFGDFGVVRFDPSGNVDGSFGPNFNGVATADFPGTGFNSGLAAAMQPDGKLIIAGLVRVRNDNLGDLALARLNTDGTLDETFGSGGIVQLDLAPAAGGDVNERITAVTIDPDGRIVFAGVTAGQSAGGDDIIVGRLNPDGSLDPSFAFGTGLLTIGPTPTREAAADVLVQPDGRIVIVGEYSVTTTNREFLAIRLEGDGNFDSSFGPDFSGTVRVAVGTAGDSVAGAVTLAPDQDGSGFDLILAGSARVSSSDQFGLARLNEDGSLDAAFGTGGKVTTILVGSSRAAANDVIIDPQGRVIAAGSARGGSSSADNFALVRYTPAGVPDTTFDADGQATTDFDGENDAANSVVLLPDGSILAGGYAGSNFGLAKYTQAGALDTNFATAGKARTDFDPAYYPGAPSVSRDTGVDLFLYPGDRAVLAGSAFPLRTSMDFAAARYVLTGPPNAAPVANIGGPYTMEEGSPAGLTISAANSADADGRIVKYEWDLSYEQFSGFFPEARGESVTIPPVADEGSSPVRRVALRVTDDDGATHLVFTTVTAVNVTPVVDAGPDVNLAPNTHFFRIGSFTDPGADTWTATVDYGTGNGFVALPLAADKTFALDWHYSDPGTYTITVRVRDNDGATGTDTVVVTVGQQANTVTGRQVFYNRSRFGQGPAAVATDKEVLLPGQAAGFRNVTSYSRGINGLLVTFRGDVTQLNADDFEFDVASAPDAAAWSDAPPPSGVTVSPGPALGTSVATIVWPDGAIRNQWLRVTVKPTANTRLASPDVFYVGNLVGETGNNGAASPFVSPADVGAVRARLFSRNRPITDAFDIDRDGVISAMDVLHVRRNVGRALSYSTAPAAPPATFSDVIVASVTEEVLGSGN